MINSCPNIAQISTRKAAKTTRTSYSKRREFKIGKSKLITHRWPVILNIRWLNPRLYQILHKYLGVVQALEWEWTECKMRAFFYSHSYSGMDRMPFHPFCSQGQNEQNVANENPKWRRDERCGFKYVSTREKIRLHFWTKWNIASNFIVPKVQGKLLW